jgi:DnaJ-class molecular chaperone
MENKEYFLQLFEVCPLCKGKGRIPRDPKFPDSFDNVICPDCAGTSGKHAVYLPLSTIVREVMRNFRPFGF